MNMYSISMIHTQPKTHIKIKYESIFIGYYKLHGVGYIFIMLINM